MLKYNDIFCWSNNWDKFVQKSHIFTVKNLKPKSLNLFSKNEQQVPYK